MLNVSGGNLAIGISLLMRDGFSGPAATAGASMTSLQRKQQALITSQTTMARNANLLGAAIGVGVMGKMAGWVQEGAKYGYTLKYVSSLTDSTAAGMAKLDQRAKDLGQNTMMSPMEILSGMRYMAMAGQTSAQIYDNIKAATNMSIATLTELGGKGGGADILTNVMAGFGIASEHAGRVADVLVTATTGANISLMDLGESMKYAASTAMDLNIGLEEVSTMAMMAGNAGIQGSMAGTAIENMMRYLAMATSGDRLKATEALGAMGLRPEDLKDAQGNLKSIGAIMHLIAKQVEKTGAGTADRQNWYMRLFGVRGKREGSLMLRNMQDYDTFLNELNTNSTGMAEKVAEGQMDTLEGRMKQWTDTLFNLKVAYTEALEPVLKPLIWALSTLVKGFGDVIKTKFGKFLLILGTGWVIAKTATMAYRAVMLTISLLTGQLGTGMVATGNSTVMSYNAMTAAATRYRSVLTGLGLGGGSAPGIMGAGVAAGVSRTARGGWRGPGMTGFITANAAHQAMYGQQFGPQNLSKTGRFMHGLGNAGSKFGAKGFGYGALASIALGLASNAAGTESTGGKVLSGVSDTASYGLMGASVGSLIAPGIGTAIGGIVGAAGGLLWNIYNQVKAVEEEVKNTDTNLGQIGEKDKWKQQAELFLSLNEGEIARAGMVAKQFTSMEAAVTPKETPQTRTEVILNIDGYEAYRDAILSGLNKSEFNIGID